jgi:hypothetical protein
MDFTTKEMLKRYAKLAIGQPFAPILLNILVTSVCDMRCTHCFFTDELDDRPRKKLQMKTEEIEKISETLGGNLGVLILAGGEPFTRKDLPEIVARLSQQQTRFGLFDVERANSSANFSGRDAHLSGKSESERDDRARHRRNERRARKNSPETGKLGQSDSHGAHFARNEKRISESRRANLHVRDELESGHDFRLVRFSEIRFEAGQNQHQLYSSAVSRPERTEFRPQSLRETVANDSWTTCENAALKNNYGGDRGFFKAAIDLYMHDLIAKTKETGEAQMKCYAGTAGRGDLRRRNDFVVRKLEAIGNLRDYDWNFQAVWNSPEMKARRKQAASGCFCTHESNSYYPSLPFNPKHLIQIKRLEKQMKKAAKDIVVSEPQTESVAV